MLSPEKVAMVLKRQQFNRAARKAAAPNAPDTKAALAALVMFLEAYPHQYGIDIAGYLHDARIALAKETGSA